MRGPFSFELVGGGARATNAPCVMSTERKGWFIILRVCVCVCVYVEQVSRGELWSIYKYRKKERKKEKKGWRERERDVSVAAAML